MFNFFVFWTNEASKRPAAFRKFSGYEAFENYGLEWLVWNGNSITEVYSKVLLAQKKAVRFITRRTKYELAVV